MLALKDAPSTFGVFANVAVQLKVDAILAVKLRFTGWLLQIVKVVGLVITGSGLTVTVTWKGVPTQAPAAPDVGVTV